MAIKYPYRREIGEMCQGCKKRGSVVVIIEAEGESGYWKCEDCGWDDKAWTTTTAIAAAAAIRTGLKR